MTGPPRTPTEIARRRGFPGKRAQNPQEPQPCPTTAEIDDDALTGPARTLWDLLAPELIRIGCLTFVDREEFATGCRLRAYGLTGLTAAEKGTGVLTERHMSALLHSSRIFARYGIGASDRTRISVAPPTAGGKWAALVS
jgi:hypothetical protein